MQIASRKQRNGTAEAWKVRFDFYLVLVRSVKNEERKFTEAGWREGFFIYNSPLKPVV